MFLDGLCDFNTVKFNTYKLTITNNFREKRG